MPSAEHIFCSCQLGAEAALKREVAARAPALRFGYSRPGFVTFKLPESTTLGGLQAYRFVFARTRGLSLGKVKGASLGDLVGQAWQLAGVGQLLGETPHPRLHVWQRDAALPGADGFEPGGTLLAAEVHAALTAAAPAGCLDPAKSAGQPRKAGVVMDALLVEPDEWWIGCHQADTRVDNWPGGTPPLVLPEHAISRAYLKMREAIGWSRFPAVKGDQWIELGCAPGGASQALLDSGMKVLGVDPADVQPAIASNARFEHLKMRAVDARRDAFTSAHWLAADINATPSYTLDAVEPIVTHPGVSIRGLVLTLKVSDWDLAAPEKIAEYIQRVRGWGYQDVRARQLAFNRQEFCLVALRSRAQRRVRRRRAANPHPRDAAQRPCRPE